MSGTLAIIDNKDKYEASYEIDKELAVEIYNCNPPKTLGNEVIYKDIVIKDIRKSNFYYSPCFYFAGFKISNESIVQFRSDFFFYTSKEDNIIDFNTDIRISSIKCFNPMLAYFFSNPCLNKIYEDDSKTLTLKLILRNEGKIVIDIGCNNIRKIELGGCINLDDKNNSQSLDIQIENYIEIFLINSIGYDELLSYIYELDIFINAYYPTGMRIYNTIVKTEKGKEFKVIHKLLGKEKTYNKAIFHKPIKLTFANYIEYIYKKINYRNTKDKNIFLPLDFKKPISLEDEFLYYFRCIDMYYGMKLQKEGRGHVLHKKIKQFLEDYKDLFIKEDIEDIEKLKNEIVSLRNHYIHQGYYLLDNMFEVRCDDKSTYIKEMDYKWLERIIEAFKQGTYIILFKEILHLDIDENNLKYCYR